MSTINIVRGHSNGNLSFEVDGQASGGDIEAEKNEKIHWKVDAKDGSVKRIVEIRLNSHKGSGSNSDIFHPNKPEPEFLSGKKHWKAKINSLVNDGDQYHYDIDWIDADGNKKTCDPIISIRPSRFHFFKFFMIIFAALASIFAVDFFRKQWNKKSGDE